MQLDPLTEPLEHEYVTVALTEVVIEQELPESAYPVGQEYEMLAADELLWGVLQLVPDKVDPVGQE